MTSLELKTAPDVRAIIVAAFPNYRKHRAFVHVFGESGHSINSYWDGGSRAEFAIVDLSTMQRKSLPTSTHPYFDVARRGLAGQENEHISVDGRGLVTLKHLPEGYALVQAGISAGKPATASVYVNAANMPRLLSAPGPAPAPALPAPPAPASEPARVHNPLCSILLPYPSQGPCNCEQLRVAAYWDNCPDEDGGRTRIGNTPTCEDCEQPLDHCTCGDLEPDEDDGDEYEGCEVCGCFPCSCDDDCPDCGQLVCICEDTPEPSTGSLFKQESLTPAFEKIDYEHNQNARAQLVADPSIVAAALPGYMALIREFDGLMRAGDITAAMAIAKRADDYADDLQGGDCFGVKCPDGACTLLEKAAAAPDGEVPLWGQCGNFTLTVGITKIRFEVDGLFGVGSPFTFSIHAVDWHKPFPSNTGYRSFCGMTLHDIPAGWDVPKWLAETVAVYIKRECKKGLVMIDAERRDRAQLAEPEPAWVPAVAPIAPASQLSLF